MIDIDDKLRMLIDLAKENKELETSIRAAAEANDTGKLADLARQHGIELSEADFAWPEEAEIDDEELEAIAGGKSKECSSKSHEFWCGFALGANKYA